MSPYVDVHEAAILIVDDQQCNVVLLERMLHRGGYRNVSSTSDPRAVFELQHLHCYDLILLDLQMPAMDGFAVMEALERDGHGPVVCVLSADPSQKSRALQAGARDFLSKPLDLREVIAHIALLLGETVTVIALPLPPPATAPPYLLH